MGQAVTDLPKKKRSNYKIRIKENEAKTSDDFTKVKFIMDFLLQMKVCLTGRQGFLFLQSLPV